MVVFKRKTRVVTLRVSDDEYAILHAACVRSGARSVSDFARDAIFGVLEPDEELSAITCTSLSSRVEQLAGDLNTLTAAFQELRRRIDPLQVEVKAAKVAGL